MVPRSSMLNDELLVISMDSGRSRRKFGIQTPAISVSGLQILTHCLDHRADESAMDSVAQPAAMKLYMLWKVWSYYPICSNGRQYEEHALSPLGIGKLLPIGIALASQVASVALGER